MSQTCFSPNMLKPLNDKNSKIVLRGFSGIVKESKRKLNNLWVQQGREFYKKLSKKWLENDHISKHLNHSKGNTVAPKIFIRTLKGKTCKKWQLMVNYFLIIWIN